MGFLDKMLEVVGGVAPLIGSGLSAASSLIGGSKVADAQREANEQNYKMFQEQLGFTKEMWQNNNEYNTPAAQRERYEAAGINPYFALGNIQGGNAESVTTPTPNPAQPESGLGQGISTAGQQVGQGVSSAASSYYQIQSQKEVLKQQKIENMYRVERQIAELGELRSRAWSELKQGDKSDDERLEIRQRIRNLERQEKMLTIELQYQSDFLSSRNDRERSLADLSYQQAVGQQIQNDMNSIVKQFLPQMQQSTLKQLNAQCAELYASAVEHKETAKLRTQQGKTEFVNTAIARLEKHSVRLSNEERERAQDYIIESLRLANESVKYNIRQQESDYTNPFRYAGMALGGAAAAATNASLRPSPAVNVVRGFK